MNNLRIFITAIILMCAVTVVNAIDQDQNCELHSLEQLKKEKKTSEKNFKWPKYKKLSFFEDYSELKKAKNVKNRDAFDKLKYIPLNADGDIWLSLGGQARIRFEDFRNCSFATPDNNDDNYLLQRYFFHSDLHLGSYVRLFLEGRSAFANSHDLPGGRKTTLHDEIDVMNAFVDVTIPITNKLEAKVRAGRFEFYYGKGRMLACRNWSQLRRPYDGYKLKLSSENWWIEGFWAQGTENRKYEFNNVNDDLSIWGFYSHISKKTILPFGLDFYVIAKDQFKPATRDERRMNIGVRLFDEIKNTNLSYDIEAATQFDYRDSREVSASMFAAELKYQWKKNPLKPWMTVGFDWASGDKDPADDKITTFEPISPFGHYYFGYMDIVGRQNIVSPWLGVGFKPTQKLMTKLDVHWFYADEPADDLYNACNCSTIIRNGSENAGDFIGTNIDVTLKYKFNHHLVGLIGYSYFFAGNFVEETAGGQDDIQRWMLQLQFSF
ncbi:MAG: alginate export family protein [Verrucomicrobiota bacterium]|nr:alginate export family protein [Verrucomicrobiota bacterium]